MVKPPKCHCGGTLYAHRGNCPLRRRAPRQPMHPTNVIYATAAFFKVFGSNTIMLPGGDQVPMRPTGRRRGFFLRLQAAWWVFTGRADALIWIGQNGDPRMPQGALPASFRRYMDSPAHPDTRALDESRRADRAKGPPGPWKFY